MKTRRSMLAVLTAGTASLLTSCGTILYPDRVNQEERGGIDPVIVGLDAVGLLLFLIPGIIAFAVDFGTGAIYYPQGHKPGDHERTIFEEVKNHRKLNQQGIELMVSKRIGRPVSLDAEDVLAIRIESLDQFAMACSRLQARHGLAAL